MIWHPISDETYDWAVARAADVRWATRGEIRMSDRRYLLGYLGQAFVAHLLERATGRSYSPGTIGERGDGGHDFGDCDVKAVETNARNMMRRVAEPNWTTWYCQVVIDDADPLRRRAAVQGHTHVSELRAAAIVDLGWGPTYALPISELELGLPPSLILR